MIKEKVIIYLILMGLLGSLLGNNARRFIKRKDSDAGEAGFDPQKNESSLSLSVFVCDGLILLFSHDV